MKKILKKILKVIGYKISKTSKILLLDEDVFVAIKKELIGNKLVFFDIGANWGQTIKKMSSNYPDAKIHAFEPSKKCFKSLKDNFKNNTVSLHNLAVGSSSSQLEFNEYSWSALNSLLKRAYGTAEILETYIVDVVTIDEFCKNIAVSHINLLKTDTEGYELNVLKGASEMMGRNKIQFVYVEIFFNENYVGQSSFGDIYNFLLENGFELVQFYDVLYTNDGLASKTDALFINKNFMN
ncbi:FkbM family methyltransferase [Flavobacterium sp. LB2P74]|uniref:FkbM family methyltransferase n=1 Tax=Flavobacterium sp. LB2P74 TaxID=3401717 RepID=UPI003AB0A506